MSCLGLSLRDDCLVGNSLDQQTGADPALQWFGRLVALNKQLLVPASFDGDTVLAAPLIDIPRLLCLRLTFSLGMLGMLSCPGAPSA